MDFDEHYVKTILPQRPQDSHKGTFGHVLNISGCGNYSGAAYFSSIAPLKVGCGRSTLASVTNVLSAVSALSPDVILLPLQETRENAISSRALKKLEKIIKNYDAISVGCGISLNNDTGKFLKKLILILADLQIPLVVDADGLSLLGELKRRLKKIDLPEHTVLTPHPAELARLMGMTVDTVLLQPEFWVRKCCEKYDCTTVLKLHKTLVADNKGNFYINNTGNTALSHGGSGDVLCGMITGFLAQGLSPFAASILAVYLHGLSAELASKDLTEYSTLASDLLKYIPEAIKTIL